MKNSISAIVFFLLGVGAHFLMTKGQETEPVHPAAHATHEAEEPAGSVADPRPSPREDQLASEIQKLRRENSELKNTLLSLQAQPVALGEADAGKDVKEVQPSPPKEAIRSAPIEVAFKNESSLDKVATPTQAEDFLASVKLDDAFKTIANSSVVTRIDKKLAAILGSYEGPIQVKDPNGLYRMRLDIQLQDAGPDSMNGRLNLIVFRDDREIIGHRSAKNIDRVRQADGSEAIWLYFDKNVIQLYKPSQSDFVSINWYRTGGPAQYNFYGSGSLSPTT